MSEFFLVWRIWNVIVVLPAQLPQNLVVYIHSCRFSMLPIYHLESNESFEARAFEIWIQSIKFLRSHSNGIQITIRFINRHERHRQKHWHITEFAINILNVVFFWFGLFIYTNDNAPEHKLLDWSKKNTVWNSISSLEIFEPCEHKESFHKCNVCNKNVWDWWDKPNKNAEEDVSHRKSRCPVKNHHYSKNWRISIQSGRAKEWFFFITHLHLHLVHQQLQNVKSNGKQKSQTKENQTTIYRLKSNSILC